MASYQPVSSSFKPKITTSVTTANPGLHNVDHSFNGSDSINGDTTTRHLDTTEGNRSSDYEGCLEVFVHHARDIQNICIYHKQDVYAKLCLTSDPDTTVSTCTINGGGQEPVFNQMLRLSVRTVDCSLKCEIFMLSRVRNYLEDQLLGFALVPLSSVLMANGKLEQDFSLSATDLYHSPAGFVRLSLCYAGSSPELMVISAPPMSSVTDTPTHDNSMASEYCKIDFPDLSVVKENRQMVSDYTGIMCSDLDSQTSADSCEASLNEAGVRVVDSFSKVNIVGVGPRSDTPASSVCNNGSPVSLPATSQSSDQLSAAALLSSATKGKEPEPDAGESEADSLAKPAENPFLQPLIKLNLEPEQTVKQEEIVDLYMKSMQQFTESLAKMKLPLDMEKNGTEAGGPDSNRDEKSPGEGRGAGPRVFYGSRAFF